MKPADISLLHALGAPAISPDGKQAVAALTRPDLDADEYRGGLWLIPTDGSAEPLRLTRGPRDAEPAYSPDGSWLAFVRGGDGAKPQLYVMPTGGGEPWKVTDQPLGAGEPVWSPDSRRLAFVARVPEEGRYGDTKPEKEGPRRITGFQYRLDNLGFSFDRHAHVFVVDPFADEPSPAQVTEGDHTHSGITWSPDGTLLAFVAARHDDRDSTLTDDVWVCAPDGSGLRRVTATDQSVAAPRFTPDGAALCYLGAGAGSDGRHVVAKNIGLWLVPLDGGAARRLTDEERFHMVSPYVPTAGGVLAIAENRGGRDLLLVPYAGGEPTVLVGGPRRVDAIAHAAGVTVASVADTSSPGELLVLRDGAAEGVLTTFGSDLDVLPVEEVNGTAPDGYPVHGWLVRPAGEGPHPVLLMIHGGPFAQYGPHVFDEAQVYASAGYAVVFGNPRGSSGYGQAHGRHIVGDVGRRSAPDLLALFDAALATGGLDASRAGVLGGSHGGFMTTWLAAHHGDRFKAAISERAVNAIDSFHGSSDIGWWFARDLYGDDPAGWVAQSPLTYADQIDRPFMIIHSEHDWRCPVEQAQRLFVRLRVRGVETEMLLFPGEGHELSRSGLPSHRVTRFEAILDWWDRHL